MDDESHKLVGLTPEQARSVAQGIIKQYHDALADAATNYPDLWVFLKDYSKDNTQPKEHTDTAETKLDKHNIVKLPPLTEVQK